MGTYRKEWPCCDSVTETQAWEPESCPFCTPSAAPASANGALTNEQIIQIITDAKIHCVHPSAATTLDIARAILAAAGPDAALTECNHEMLCAAMKAAVTTKIIASHADEETYLRNWNSMKIVINAALSAAKGN